MKITTLGWLLCAAVATPSFAGFVGAADPSQWAVTNMGTLIGGSPTPGSASFSPTTLVITGGNSVSPDPPNLEPGCAGGLYGDLTSPCQIQAVLSGAGDYAFDWSYDTADAGGPSGDIFGVIVDGVRIAISDPGGPSAQSGVHRSYNASTSFGFFVNCTDCIEGGATATISNFSAPDLELPEPASMGLVAMAALALAFVRTRRRRRWVG